MKKKINLNYEMQKGIKIVSTDVQLIYFSIVSYYNSFQWSPMFVVCIEYKESSVTMSS